MSYSPSKYWNFLNKECENYLKDYGYDSFKRSVGIVYNDYFICKGKLDTNYDDKLKTVWDSLHDHIPHKFLDRFSEPAEGQPLTIKYRGRLVSFDLASSITEYYLLSHFIDMNKVKVINEIGGGYGRLPYVILQLHPKITYNMYDFQTSLKIANQYLLNVLPGKYDINFYDPDQLKGKCDILIAINCLHEMTRKQVYDYFDYANENTSYFYYTGWKEANVPHDNITWRMEDYPIRPSWKFMFYGDHRFRNNFFEALFKVNPDE